MTVIEYLDRRSKPFILISGFLLLLCIGFIDYTTGYELNITVFYLIPIAFIAWYMDTWVAVLFAVAGSVIWYLADWEAGHRYTSDIIGYWDDLIRLSFFIVMLVIIVKLKVAYKNEQVLARTDSLTGVYNARYLYHLAEMEVERARRYGHVFSAAILDIDNFKEINSLFGHIAGDSLLRSCADTIKDNLRSVDVIARLGGDEFIILLPESGREAARAVMDKIQKLLLDEMQKNNWPVTFSIGAVTFNKPPNSVDELIQKADNLMYLVKASGKNQVLYDEGDDKNTVQPIAENGS